MAHPRWPGFDTKTGDPRVDNANMRLNRRLWRDTQKRFKITASSRKRRKHLLRVEGARYIQIVAAVMADLARKD